MRRAGRNSRTCGNVARFLAKGRSGAAKVLIQGRGGIGQVERGRRLEAGLDVQKIYFAIISGSENSVPLSGFMTANSLRNSFGPARSQSMLKMRVQVCEVRVQTSNRDLFAFTSEGGAHGKIPPALIFVSGLWYNYAQAKRKRAKVQGEEKQGSCLVNF